MILVWRREEDRMKIETVVKRIADFPTIKVTGSVMESTREHANALTVQD
jgi:hypothetical protein